MTKRSRLRFQNRVLLPALVAAGPAWLLVAVLLWQSDEPVGLRWTLFAFVSVFFLIGIAAVRQRVDPAAALAREHARSAARGRLLDARPEHRSLRLDGRGHGRGQLARPHAARPAPRGARGRRAAAKSDRGRRHRGVRIRLAPAAAARESSRAKRCSAAPRTSFAAAAPRSSGSSGCLPSRRAGSSRTCSRAARGAGRFAGAASARAASRASCS